MRQSIRANFPRACAISIALALIVAWAGPAHADQQRDPELKALLQKIIGSTDCFADKYESEVWYKSMEPRLAKFVPTHAERVEILDHVYCEAKRDPTLQIPPDLVLALMEVESRFDRWAVSPAGAVGLMQVMPFWPRQLGVQNQLVKVAPNIRMGCEILRYYLRVEHRNWSLALARYNGSVGRNTYPALVMQRWERAWRF
jgi:soluble lytic murein transglycosylase-like protein